MQPPSRQGSQREKHRKAMLLCVVLLSVFVFSARAASLAVPVDGEPFAANLTAVDASWRLTFAMDGQRRVLAADDLVRWGDRVEPRRGPLIVFADGGFLPALPTKIDKAALVAESALFGEISLPLEQVAGLVFHLPADRRRRERLLDRVSESSGTSDRIWLANGDEIAGSILGLADEAVRIDMAVGPSSIAVDDVAALAFNPALRRPIEKAGPRVWIGLADGGMLLASRLLLEKDKTPLRITMAAGQEWSTAAGELVFIQPLGERVVYLGDITPAEFRHVPFLDLPWSHRANRNVTGGLLRSGGRVYLKGLGMHGLSRITYALAEPFARFEAELGIDDSTDGGGSVRYRVVVDGKEAFTSDILRGGMKPVTVRVDLSGAKRLDLVVDFADRADQLDHADWLDARLIRGQKPEPPSKHEDTEKENKK